MNPLLNDGLTIFFPVYNEVSNLEPMVGSCMEIFPSLTDDPELIIVDDGSTDGSGSLADSLKMRIPYLRVVHHEQNRGYGAALQSGFAASTKEYVFYTDGDQQFDIRELCRILPLTSQFDVISCFRIKREDHWIRSMNATIFSLAINLIFGLKIKDPDCAFKIYSRRVLNKITMSSQGAMIDVEMLLGAKRNGFSIFQTGVQHFPRQTGRSTGGDPGVIFRAMKEIIQLTRRQGWRFSRRRF